MPPEHPSPSAVAVAPAPPKRPRGRPRAPFGEAEAVSQYLAGYSVGTLARAHKISISTVMAALRRAKVVCRGPRYRQDKSLPPLNPGAPAQS